MPVIAFDGKTIRCASKRATDKLHLVSAYDCDSGLTLLHNCVDSKTNEIPAVRELLHMLGITGAMVTLDAMHCQKETLNQLISRKADYVVQAKGNQKKLYSVISNLFQQQFDSGELGMDTQVTSDKGHGREEIRTVYRLDATLLDKDIRQTGQAFNPLLALSALGRRVKKTSIDTHYYLSSSRDNTLILKAIRQHWLIENQQYWILDVVFKEDSCQIHEALSAQHMALFRRVVRNRVKQHTKSKGSIRSKLVAASFDDDFRAELLFG